MEPEAQMRDLLRNERLRSEILRGTRGSSEPSEERKSEELDPLQNKRLRSEILRERRGSGVEDPLRNKRLRWKTL
jgi:hypothetical protein